MRAPALGFNNPRKDPAAASYSLHASLAPCRMGVVPTLFDRNMALLSYRMEHDDLGECLSNPGSKKGRSFVDMVRSMLNADIRSKLVALKDCVYEDLGFDCLHRKLKVANHVEGQIVKDILALPVASRGCETLFWCGCRTEGLNSNPGQAMA